MIVLKSVMKYHLLNKVSAAKWLLARFTLKWKMCAFDKEQLGLKYIISSIDLCSVVWTKHLFQ